MGIRHSNPCPMKTEIKTLLKQKPVIVYSKRGCQQQTHRILDLFTQIQVAPEVVQLNASFESLETERALFQLLGAVEFPMVLVNGRFIGGYSSLRKSVEQGRIQTLLKKAQTGLENAENIQS